jgi:hypothetical protein
MLEKLRNFLFKLRAQKYLSQNLREHRFVSYEKAKSVLLLFESEFNEKNPYIRKMIAQLQQDGKRVSAWGFIDKKEIMTSILPDFRILHHKQTDFFSKPSISFINELDNQEFDLLIDLTINKQLPLQYIAVYAKASCKIGIHKSDLSIYDFVIDVESLTNQSEISETEELIENLVDNVYLYNQIIFYLKSIQTTD